MQLKWKWYIYPSQVQLLNVETTSPIAPSKRSMFMNAGRAAALGPLESEPDRGRVTFVATAD
jgi:hypothetical protein